MEQRNSTPGKASATVQNMLNENSLPPSIQDPFGELVDNFTPQSKSTATASQEVLSQISDNSDAASIELLSQKPNISPSEDTNPERILNFEPSPERRPKRNSQPPTVFDVAQVQQEEKERKKQDAKKRSSPYPTGNPKRFTATLLLSHINLHSYS